MPRRDFGRELRRLFAECIWRTMVACSPKIKHQGVVISDITSTQSKYRLNFRADVCKALDELDDDLLACVHQSIKIIARVEIRSDYDYYGVNKLLAIRVNYSADDKVKDDEVKRILQEAFSDDPA